VTATAQDDSDSGGRRIVVGGALLHQGRVLSARRSAPAETAGRWEFPGVH
jgi:8-oxo-dGTP diphosphatase